MVATFCQPFDLLAETTVNVARSMAAASGNSSKNEIWLPFLNAYRTMCVAPAPEFQRLLEQFPQLDLAASAA